MIIDLRLPAGALRLWHVRLAEALAALPGVALRTSRGRAAAGTAPLLYALEAIVYGGGPARLPDPAPADALAALAPAAGAADLLLDVSGDALDGAKPGLALSLTADGLGVDDGLLAAVLAGAVPTLALDRVTAAGRQPLARWTLAMETRRTARLAVEGPLARAVQLAVGTVARIVDGQAPAPEPGLASDAAARPAATPGMVGAALFGAGALAARIGDRLRRLAGTAPRWFVAIRAGGDGPGLPDLAKGAPFRRLADDGARFFADPFVWREDGRTVVFVEEFPFATGKGIIAAVDVAADGTMGRPYPVLETASHLSYPQVFTHGGHLWMIPESSAARTVELWRCTRFPDRWEREQVLIEGRDLSDATVAEIDGRWVMFAAGREPLASTWEALELWSAPALTGPWTPMAAGPALVDARAARPAGAPFKDGERWIRPVQICDDRYGAGLGFAAIERIDGFRQRMVATLRPPKPHLGLHSYNRGAGLEVVDLYGPAGGGDVRLG